MNRLQLYHRLPYFAKVAAASLHGLKLERLRYGDDTQRLLADAEVHEIWDAQAWREYHRDQLKPLLRHAAANVPFYRQLWEGRQGSPEHLKDWPILEKDQVRQDPENFLADGIDRRTLYRENTSGSTGKPLRLYWSQATLRGWYALLERRTRNIYGVSRHDRWAILGGQLVADSRRRRPPFWVWNAGMNQLYLSSYHLSPKTVGHYIDEIRRQRIVHILGYSSALHSLAGLALQENVDLSGLNLKVAVTNAEPLFPHQRQIISQAFGCPVRETYGQAEVVATASECSTGRLHWWPETGIVEIVDDDGHAVGPGETGSIVATGFLNDAQPLIRYRVGDRARRPASDTACSCGMALPVLAAVEGRLDDVVITADGRQIGRLDTVFKGDLPILEAQIVQERAGALILSYVPAPEFDASHAQSLRSSLERHVGEMEIELREAQSLPRSANGKLRAVVNKIPKI